MKKIIGISASHGIAMGRVFLYRGEEEKVTQHNITDVDREISRLKAALQNSIAELDRFCLQSGESVGEDKTKIFQVHKMMLQDEDFMESICSRIKEKHVNAEYAVWETGKEFAANFARMNSVYMRERKADVLDISNRLLHNFNNHLSTGCVEISSPSILAADHLNPSETIQLDQSRVLAIVTRKGSKISHSAILSRTMGIPSVVGLERDFHFLKNGMFVIVDGTSGEVILEPDCETKQKYEKKHTIDLQNRQKLHAVLKSETVSKDGKKIGINANIGNVQDVEKALENGADGIGLFRSEFLYMQRDGLPSEEEQFYAYKTVLEKMKGRTVIVRTFDIGADKQVPYLNLPKEINPAMGYRAIRICLDRKALFFTQLKALLRASVYGKLKIMFPMITSLAELREAKAIVQQVKEKLQEEQSTFEADIPIGIMIETPAAVMLSDKLSQECDFFSIGTNDLTQYTLAVDRMNSQISKLYNPSHPAVLKMIELTVKSAHQAGIPVGICGESAADKSLTQFYLRIGIDELSVAPSLILELKKTIMNTTVD